MFRLFGKRLSQALRDEDGNVIILVSLAAFMLVLAAGTAIDMARAQILQIKISSALDAAGLGAEATSDQIPAGLTKAAWVQQQATRYFNANFPSQYLESNPTVNVVATLDPNDSNTINLTATTTQSTSFMKIVGINTLSVGAHSQVTRNSSGLTEVVMVLDNTGSMNSPVDPADNSTSKLDALKSSATSLVNILFAQSNNGTGNFFVGLVPFSTVVNIGTAHTTWMNPPDIANAQGLDWGPPTHSFSQWDGCVYARYYPYDVQDDAPNASNSNTLFAPFYYIPYPNYISPYDNWVTSPVSQYNINTYQWTTPPALTYASPLDTVNYGPNWGCPQQVTPMTATKSTILDGINAMVATGDTMINIGAAWGWRMLSPNWNGLWGGDMNANNLPQPYNVPGSQKVLILMTDGWNHFTPYNQTSYGSSYDAAAQSALGSSDEATQEALLDARTKWVCDSLKYHSVLIFTIAFGVNDVQSNPDSANYALLQYCATDSAHFFSAQTNEQLQKAFQGIANSLVNLRVSQ